LAILHKTIDLFMMARGGKLRPGFKVGRGTKVPKYKKEKAGGAPVSKEVREVIAMEKPSVPVMSRPKTRGDGEKKTISTVSNTRNRKIGKPFGFKSLMDLLCPIFQYTRVGYGNRWDLRHGDAPIPGFSDKQGSCTNIFWSAGQQGWAEFCALPMHNFGGQGTSFSDAFMYDGFGCSVSELIHKSGDIRNDAQSTIIARGTTTASMINTQADLTVSTEEPKALLGWTGLTFDYHGGYQSHSFINMSENKISIELWELQPRNVEQGVKRIVGTANKLRTRAVWEDVAVDYKSKLPLANNRYPQYTESVNETNVSQDYKHDMDFRINKDSNRTHLKYMVGKSVRISIAPGDKYIHKIILDPFSFTESSWNVVQGQYDSTSTAALSNGAAQGPAMLIPLFTKMLVVRAWSELGARLDEAGAYVAGVGHLPGQLAHTCTEHHKCRMMPYQKPYQRFEENLLSDAATHSMDYGPGDHLSSVSASGLAENALS
jgi:hypothetical protein